ncbi:hypothetical protein B484DRAFT_478564, partial [Ochromonadaceae sp. CCMP2298]
MMHGLWGRAHIKTKLFFLVCFVFLTLTRAGAGAPTAPTVPSFTSLRAGARPQGPYEYEEHTLYVLGRIENASSFEELYDTIEQIPAVKQSVDKSMRIVLADAEDAVMAAHAIQKFAQMGMTFAPRLDRGERDWLAGIKKGDRRFDQLAECVEICVSAMRIPDLARYVWGLTLLGVVDDEKYGAVLLEYAGRVGLYKQRGVVAVMDNAES